MKILLSSYVFAPSVGGIETVSALLAPEFVKAGHEVIVVTGTVEQDNVSRPYPVFRRPGPAKLIELVRWCDVYFQSNISLRFAWPLLFIRRPWVIAHQTWLCRSDGTYDWAGRMKYFLTRYGTNTAISHPLADALPGPVTVTGNPYSDTVFKQRETIHRERDLVYLGRLVSEKGVDLLIRALTGLRVRGVIVRLTVIGSGSEEHALRELANTLGVGGQIDFIGAKTGEELAHLLNAHHVLVVPSKWPEPFGLVVLEGIASGCVVVVSRTGGLPGVVGPHGVTFERDNQLALTDVLFTVLTKPEERVRLLRGCEIYLKQFQPAHVAARYLKLFEAARSKISRRLVIYAAMSPFEGDSSVVLSLARQFRRQGWKVLVLIRRREGRSLDGAGVRALREVGCEVRIPARDGPSRATLSSLASVRLQSGDQVFVSLCHDKVSSALASLGKFKRSLYYAIAPGEKGAALKILVEARRRYSGFAVSSPLVLEPLRKLLGPGVPVRWLPPFDDFDPNGGKLAVMTPAGTRQKLAFGFLGALDGGEGVRQLLETWPQLRGAADLRIAGDGPLRPVVENAASQSGGFISYEDAYNVSGRDEFLRRFFASIDYLIVPSVDAVEGLSPAILEALSNGVPVLASNLGATACFDLDWLKPRHPGVVQLFPVGEIKAVIETQIKNGFPTREQRLACIEYYQEWFSNEATLKRWIDVVEPTGPNSRPLESVQPSLRS